MANIERGGVEWRECIPRYNIDDVYVSKKSSVESCGSTDYSLSFNVIEWDELTNMTYMKQGAMCNIFAADYGGMRVVVKVPRTDCKESDNAVNDLEVELEMLHICNHEHIIKLIGAGWRPSKPHRFIVVEYLEMGTLADILDDGENDGRAGASGPKNVKKTKKYQIFHIMRMVERAIELASAIAYLHDEVCPYKFVIHRDIKPDNVGFKRDGTLKLFDFGLARVVTRRNIINDRYDMTGETGSMRYMAPEVVESLPYNEKVDVYAFGLLMWEMLQTTQVFIGMSVREFYTRVINEGARPPLEDSWPEELRRLISNCWHHDADRRPPFSNIIRNLHAISGEQKHTKIAMSSISLMPQHSSRVRVDTPCQRSSDINILRSMTFPDDVIDMSEKDSIPGSDLSVRRSRIKKAGVFRRLKYIFSKNKKLGD